MSASVGLTRYRIVEEDIPSSLWHEVEDRLKRNSFRDIDASAEERSFGWVSFDNISSGPSCARRRKART